MKIYIKKQFCPYLPLKAGKFFKNLEILYVMNSNVQHLLNGDLDGLDKLIAFDVSHNPIEQLGRDFFKGHGTIQKISFFDCHLKIIDAEALSPLVNLKEATFQYNVCLDFRGNDNHYDVSNSIRSLKMRIRDSCHSEKYGNQVFNQFDDVKPSPLSSRSRSLSFAQRNANLIISLFLIISVVLTAVLVKVFHSKFNNNWSELKKALIWNIHKLGKNSQIFLILKFLKYKIQDESTNKVFWTYKT